MVGDRRGLADYSLPNGVWAGNRGSHPGGSLRRTAESRFSVLAANDAAHDIAIGVADDEEELIRLKDFGALDASIDLLIRKERLRRKKKAARHLYMVLIKPSSFR